MLEVKPLQGQVKLLVEDLRRQVRANAELSASLKEEYAQARAAGRIGVPFETFLEGVLDQAAVAWVLCCVFVRFCEDNDLVDRIWLGGPDPAAPADRAIQARQAHLIANPLNNDRHWLLEAFTYLKGLRATAKIFDMHNSVWRYDISGEAAETLSDFFRRGNGFRPLRTDNLDTRFLGDLYQDLSAHARSTYALLQTPEFVEEFILDRTFEPAVKQFGLDETSVIDPTCGSGHFLLGTFERLLRMWKDREPATPVETLVERALGQVTGVDINPFAVAIARFRLVVAALRATGRRNLNTSYPIRVATGDSLLDWDETRSRHQGDLIAELEGRPAFAFYTEDGDYLAEYLRPGTYTVVIGNPPYIPSRDRILNERYRHQYSACAGKFVLTVPFAQRFFQLAKTTDDRTERAGYVGQITSNSFMKREFGRKLIEDFFFNQVELTEVIDTSGIRIADHGTPTVILIGRNRTVSSRYSGRVRVALGTKADPPAISHAQTGYVWPAIQHQIDLPGSESSWLSVNDFERERLSKHPWSLGGGGAIELMRFLEADRERVVDRSDSVGITCFTLEDDLYLSPPRALERKRISKQFVRAMVQGDGIRDWTVATPEHAIFPYTNSYLPTDLSEQSALLEFMWPARTSLSNSMMFGNKTKVQSGLRWSEYGRLTASKFSNPLSITFAFVGTHNHFALDHGDKLFKQTAPVIKLTSTDLSIHLGLLGCLNSSTICFLLKQVCQDRGSGGIGGGVASESWERFFEYTATRVQALPTPSELPVQFGEHIDRLAQELVGLTPTAVIRGTTPSRSTLSRANAEFSHVRSRMVALQEELDWEVYRLYGMLDEDLAAEEPPGLKLGERAFEIVLARKMAAGEVETQWFTRHGSTPITEFPEHWPAEYKQLVERRIAIIESDRNIGLIERPECKRRWASESWESMEEKALRAWLLDRLEAVELWGGAPTPLSVAQLADRIRHDQDFRSVLDLWVGTDQHDLTKTLSTLVADEHVPFLPADRYKPSGLSKRAQWERTWALQRREDAGEKVNIAVPLKYASADFVKASYWRNRGKLDVPKERFISYPRMGRDGDGTELLGWAGWDHPGQAQALAGVYLDRKTQAGWSADRLLPLIAGMAELEPWLKQWHNEPAQNFPGSAAEFFTGLIDTELAYLGADRPALAKLRGVEDLT